MLSIAHFNYDTCSQTRGYAITTRHSRLGVIALSKRMLWSSHAVMGKGVFDMIMCLPPNHSAIAVWKGDYAKMTAVDPAQGNSNNMGWKKRDSFVMQICAQERDGGGNGRLTRAKEVTGNAATVTSAFLCSDTFPNGSRHTCKLEMFGVVAESRLGNDNQPGVTFWRKQQRFDPKYIEGVPRTCLHPINAASRTTVYSSKEIPKGHPQASFLSSCGSAGWSLIQSQIAPGKRKQIHYRI
ncbi:hypothetical protein IW262DRAFT_1292973 [Armillaria fumosa]|nr:hypothetical protein IW262DRAFT_1292973 [Armillaria fumosa]